jgi:DNA-binding NarL/FixJ family response regulator
MPGAYRILLAEDHTMFREMIVKCLEDFPGLEIVGEVGDGEELLKSVSALRPNLIVLDIEMPRLSGLEAARKIKQAHPEIKILLLTMHKSTDHLTHALDAGIDGYLLKENVFQDLVTAIDARYRTIASPAARGLAGLSEGGYGALNIGLHHIDKFGTIEAMSP